MGLDILAVGNLVWETTLLLDRPPREGETPADLESRAVQIVHDGGGSEANALVAAAAMGLSVAMVGRAGDDEPGRLAAESLSCRGVDARIVRMAGRATKLNSVLVVAGGGEPTFVATVPPRVAPPARPSDVPACLLASARVLHLDRVSATGLDLAMRRARAGLAVTLDLHDAPQRPEAMARVEALLPCLSLLQVRGDAAAALGRRWGLPSDPCALAEGLARRVPAVAITLGAEGSVACEAGGTPVVVPAVTPSRLMDPTGAGDAHAAALIAGLVRGVPFRDALRDAAEAGSRACSALGARGAWGNRVDG
jgi:ribokinase